MNIHFSIAIGIRTPNYASYAVEYTSCHVQAPRSHLIRSSTTLATSELCTPHLEWLSTSPTTFELRACFLHSRVHLLPCPSSTLVSYVVEYTSCHIQAPRLHLTQSSTPLTTSELCAHILCNRVHLPPHPSSMFSSYEVEPISPYALAHYKVEYSAYSHSRIAHSLFTQSSLSLAHLAKTSLTLALYVVDILLTSPRQATHSPSIRPSPSPT